MTSSGPLSPYFDRLERGSTLRWRGRVLQVVGNLIESEGPFCSIGESCEVTSSNGRKYAGEVIGFGDRQCYRWPSRIRKASVLATGSLLAELAHRSELEVSCWEGSSTLPERSLIRKVTTAESERSGSTAELRYRLIECRFVKQLGVGFEHLMVLSPVGVANASAYLEAVASVRALSWA